MPIKTNEIPDPFGPPRPPAATKDQVKHVTELQRGVASLSKKRLEEIQKNRDKAAGITPGIVIR